jgi:hypothetical protein
MTARSRGTESNRGRDRLASLTRSGPSRALAPDGARARLGEIDPLTTASRARAARAALATAGAVLLVLAAPAAARGIGTTDAAHALVARAVEHAVSSEIGGRLTLGGIDYLDGERLVGHDVRLEDAHGEALLDVDAVELEYDVASLLAGRLVVAGGTLKGGRVMLARADAHDREVGARTDLVRLDRVEAIHVAVIGTDARALGDEHALVRLRVGADGAVVVDATRL